MYPIASDGVLHDRPVMVDVFEDVLYVVGFPNGTVWKTHKFGRSDDHPIHGVTILSPFARLRVVHPAKRCLFQFCDSI